MELTKLFMNNLNFSASSAVKESSVSTSNSNNKFEKCLNNVSSKNEASKASEKQYSKEKVKNLGNEKNVNSDKENYSEKDMNKVEQSNESLNKTDKNSSAEKTEKKDSLDSQKKISEKEEEVIKEVAEVLGVSVEEVQKVLEQLNINVFELSNSDNLTSFMQKIFDVDSPVELLTVDGIKDMLMQTKDIVGDFEDLGRQIREMRENTYSADLTETQNAVSEEMPEETQNSGVLKALDLNNGSVEENVLNTDSENNRNDLTDNRHTVGNTNQSSFNDDSLGQSAFQQNNSMGYAEESQIDMRTDINISSMDNVTKAFAQVMSKTESLRNVNTADVINQIVEKLKAGVIKEDVSEIKITLKPEYLGDVSLKILSENGIISAQFTAENQRIKEIIEANFNQLRDMLNDQGLQVSQLSVSVGNKDGGEAAQQFYFEQQEKSGRRISNIINGISEETVSEDETVQYIDENSVLETSVNYTA